MSTDPLKETIKGIVKNISFRNSHPVILKSWKRVNVKIQNSTIMVITVYEIKSETYKIKRFDCLFLKIRDKYLAENWKAG